MIHSTDVLSFTPHVGRKCWVDMPHMTGAFPGDVMLAQVVEGHRPARDGMAWVRQLPTPALPFPGEEGGWVSERADMGQKGSAETPALRKRKSRGAPLSPCQHACIPCLVLSQLRKKEKG